MDSPSHLRELLLRYRLRELDEAERANLDALLIGDADYFATFQEAEYDLLDAYAANELTPSQRTRVEQALRPHTRITAASFQPHPARRQSDRKPAIPSSPRTLPIWMPIAAALFIATLVGVAWHRRTQPAPSSQITVSAPQPPAPIHPLPTSPLPAPVTPQPAPSLIATLLLPQTTRSQNSLAVTLFPTTQTLSVSWPRPADATPSTRYQLEILTTAGTLAATIPGKLHGHLIEFPCPVATIPTGTNFFRIIAQPAALEAPPLLETTVTISRP